MLKTPHIAVNTRLLLKDRLEGISRFTYEVLRRLTTRHPEVHFSFIFDRPYDESFIFGANVEPHVLFPQARHPVLWHSWFHFSTPLLLRRLKPDLYFSPEFYLSGAKDLPQVPVFHDLAYEHFPEDIGRWAAAYCRHYSPRYARKAAHILTVSEYSRQDLATRYQLPLEKISVVYNGASEHFRPMPEAEQAVVRARYSRGCPYFYFVGTLQPRKNISRLLRAFDQFRAGVSEPVKLLVVGRKGWKYREAMQTYEQMRFKEEVVFTGFVSDEELAGLAASALALCYVPYLEGFGIPVLEAMYCDTPVICSNLSSLPEVAGQGAMLVDPFKEEDIARAMQAVYADAGLRQQLIEAARLQRQQFSWDQTSQRVWQVLSRFL
ncbi:MAG: glycosyltransferase family 1 protein [Bacteroidetes bacterium]|nr:MAG: glycosyltransferase family 1 protein [Bacteroidota bacterium]